MQEFKHKIIGFSIGTVVAIGLVLLAMIGGIFRFGNVAGGYEATVQAHGDKWDIYEPDIKEIPVLQESVNTLKDDVKYTRQGVDDIKNLLLNRK
jgi:hypothetical protein